MEPCCKPRPGGGGAAYYYNDTTQESACTDPEAGTGGAGGGALAAALAATATAVAAQVVGTTPDVQLATAGEARRTGSTGRGVTESPFGRLITHFPARARVTRD